MSIEKVDFQKVVKEQIPYTLVYTKVIQHIHDPLALAMWVYLLSLPSEWNINKTQLKKHFKIGDDRLKRTLAFLSKTNLIEYVRMRNAQGVLGICAINVLCGNKFVNIQEDIECATTGVKATPVENHTCGNPSPYKRNKNIKENKEKKGNISCASDDARANETFDIFWIQYKRKKDRARALAIWKKNKLWERSDEIMTKLIQQNSYDAQYQTAQFIPHPTTYLRNQRWEDEITLVSQNKKEHPVTSVLRELQDDYLKMNEEQKQSFNNFLN